MKLLQQTLLALLLFVSSAYLSFGIELKKEVLRGTKPLTLEGDLAERMLVGAHRFLDRKLAETLVRRSKHWEKGLSSPKKKEGFLDDNRKELARILGVTYKRVPFEAPSLMSTTTRSAKVTTGSGYEVLAIRWPVLEGVLGEGLLLQPTGRKPVAHVIVIPDADQSPEDVAGLTTRILPAGQFARRLAENGCRVVVPALVGRNVQVQSERRKGIKISDREFLHRSAFLMGRTLQGFEIQKVLALVDWFEREKEQRIGLIGWGEGGMLALQAGALDTRVDAVCMSGQFGPREDMWREPLERNLFGFLNHFGDAELAGLLVDRALVVEAAKGPEVVIDSTGAAPGRLITPSLAKVRDEFSRAKILVSSTKSNFSLFTGGEDGKGSPGESQALAKFFKSLSLQGSLPERGKTQKTATTLPDSKAREERAFLGIAAHVQELVEQSHLVRTSDFQPDISSLDAYAKSTISHRRRFEEEVIGRFEEDLLPLSPRSRKIYDEQKWTGHEVVLDVYPELFAYGVLLVPKNVQPGERRPVVVCQHGLEGRPKDVIEGDHRAYHDFAAKLCEKGYVVFAPQNPYLMGDKFRSLQRKANPMGKTLFSLMVAQHRQIVRWLGELPFTDPKRIAFYGLSYGGKTAMRVPALVEGYCLSICSADFNDWIRKTGSTRPGDDRYSYPFTSEYEIFEFNLGHTFNYAEMAALIAPRPFMVERGHFDGVAPDEWVAAEYSKIRRLYTQLKIPNRTEIEWFPGPHTINGQGTFRFLDKWLGRPPKKK
ncbi:dienelactone hydrolase family protein [Opitutales bacterium]|nr:dienelactone hydrolase family protein [Opitutales bacterium]